jgi:uncharacterized membrane protein YkvA (DUF1232 family)
MLDRLRQWARTLKHEVLTLWFACRHPGTPWTARLVAAIVAGYALSPIDLIPDFIPVVGYLDDLILVPIGIWLALRLLPAPVADECRRAADEWTAHDRAKPRNYVAAGLIAVAWVAATAALGLWAWRRFHAA